MRAARTLFLPLSLLLACDVGAEAGDGPDAGLDLRPDGGGRADANPTADASGSDAVAATCYSEPAFPHADLGDVLAGYGGADWKDELIEAVGRRWPAGGWLLDAQRNDSYFNQFSDPNSWPGMVGILDTLVHEETHLFNAYHAIAEGQPHSLYLREDLILYLPAEQGFPRAEIQPLLAPGTDGIYASYLQGQQGQRGLNALLDELTAYANELAAVGLLGEYYPGAGVSLRDGSVAFLYYLQLYLRRARTAHPDFYQWARNQPAYVAAVETLWLRTHFFLEFADAHPKLGISDHVYRAAMHEPANEAEIEQFIGKPVGDSPCLAD